MTPSHRDFQPSDQSLLSYYRQEGFNPVPIAVESPEAWEKHVRRRVNLYQRHLHLPMGWLRERRVLEFGPNAGENALVLASMGANVTLVEPNDQVIPRMRSLFERCGLERRLVAVFNEGIDDFSSNDTYDLVLAEGFLFTLPNRDALVGKLVGWLERGGIGIVSFNDRHGMFLEMLRRAILWRAYQISGLRDADVPKALGVARRLYGDDFAALDATRPFDTWWKDTLVNPLISSMWSYQELLARVQEAGCEFHGSSPAWSDVDEFGWYKRVPEIDDRHERLRERWSRLLPYVLTGTAPRGATLPPADSHILDGVARCTLAMSRYGRDSAVEVLQLPGGLCEYLAATGDPVYRECARDLERLFEALPSMDLDTVIQAYHDAACVRRLWGTPYHYMSFVTSLVPDLRS